MTIATNSLGCPARNKFRLARLQKAVLYKISCRIKVAKPAAQSSGMRPKPGSFSETQLFFITSQRSPLIAAANLSKTCTYRLAVFANYSETSTRQIVDTRSMQADGVFWRAIPFARHRPQVGQRRSVARERRELRLTLRDRFNLPFIAARQYPPRTPGQQAPQGKRHQ